MQKYFIKKIIGLQLLAVLLFHISNKISAASLQIVSGRPCLHAMFLALMSAICLGIYTLFRSSLKTGNQYRVLTTITYSLGISVMVIPILVLPDWVHSPYAILQTPAVSFRSLLAIFFMASPHLILTSFAHILGLWSLPFAFWQITNNTLSTQQASSLYPILIVSFAVLHSLSQGALRMLAESSANPALLFIALLAPTLYIYTMISKSFDIKKQTFTPSNMFSLFLRNKNHRPFFILSTSLSSVTGMLTAFSFDISTLNHDIIEPASSLEPMITGLTITLSTILAYIGLHLKKIKFVLSSFAWLVIVLGALLLYASSAPTYILLSLYTCHSLKFAKHALFTAPRQLIFMSWTPDLRTQGKAFFDLLADRFSFGCGMFMFYAIKMLSIISGHQMYCFLSITLISLSLIGFYAIMRHPEKNFQAI